ncbi:hypothetical protein PAXINDRAFT_83349, partial [Paxillus involutus ATCC 200175]
DHYHIAESSSKTIDIMDWLSDNQGDPALVDFNDKLKDHLLARLGGLAFDGEEHAFTDADRDSLIIRKNRIYLHSFLRVNYTTYDLRREQDSISSRTHPDLMVLSHEDGSDGIVPHPYWYGRVIHIFHVDVLHFKPGTELNPPDIQRINVLFVRWFGRETSIPTGFAAKQLHRVGFLDSTDPSAFGFLDPDQVVRGIHLIPAFTHGRTGELLPPSIARPAGEIDDWKLYYVNM